MRGRAIAAVVAIALCAVAADRDVAAQPAQALVLASNDPSLIGAVHDALAPAGMTVIATDDAAPSSIADIAIASRTVVAREHASAAMWIAPADTGSTLVVYDRAVDRSLMRTLPYAPPFSPSQAAEAARTVRTMLRALRASDESQPQVTATEDPPLIGIAQPFGGSRRTILALQLDGGVRLSGPAATAAPSGAFAAILRPDTFGGVITARFAPTADVASETFMGRISDESLGIAVRMPFVLAPRLTVAGTAGVSAHLISLHGDNELGNVSELRVDPAVCAGVTVTYELVPTIAIGLGVSGDLLLQRQEYASGTDRVLVVPRAQLSGGIVIVAHVL